MNQIKQLSLLVLIISINLIDNQAYAQTPITNNDYRIDISQGLVLSGSRITGLGGAFTAISTNIDGAPYNPASYAARDRWEHRRATWGLGLGVAFPGQFATRDYFNNAREVALSIDDSFYLDLGFRLQVGHGGGGVYGKFQRYNTTTSDSSAQSIVQSGVFNAGVSAALFHENLVIGAGVRLALLQIKQEGFSRALVSFQGLGPEIGAIIRPEDRRFRVGAAVKLPVTSTIVSGVEAMDSPETVNGYYLPQSVNLPWEFRVGVAFQLGERDMNVRWTRAPNAEARAQEERDQQRCARIETQLESERQQSNLTTSEPQGPTALPQTLPHPSSCQNLSMPSNADFWQEEIARRQTEDENFEDRIEEVEDEIDVERFNAYDQSPRRYFLISADVGMIGPIENSIGIDAFLDQELRSRVTKATPILGIGIEGEPWRNRLKLRSGMYIEPARNQGTDFRVHGTGGADLRLFRWTVFEDNPWDFRIGFVFDIARAYTNVGFSMGLWH